MVDIPGKYANKPSGIAPEVKDDAWYLQWAQFMYAQWRDNKCLVNNYGFPAHSNETIAQLRAYARGKQDINKYKQILDKEIKMEDNQTATLLNISWRIPQVLPTFRERIIDRIMEVRFDPTVIAVDEMSMQRKDLMFMRDKVAASPEGRQLSQVAGMAPTNVTDNAMTMTETELEQFKALGGYQLSTEMALTEACMATIDLCKLFPSVYRQVIEDLVDIGVAHVLVKHNPGDRMQTIEYVDPEYAIVPLSEYDDCRDQTWGAVLRTKTLAAIKMESGFDDETMKKVAKLYGNRMNNSRFANNGDVYGGARRNFAAGNGTPYDPFEAMVLEGYFSCSEAESFIAGIHDSGSKVMEKVPYGTKINPRSEEKGFKVINTVRQDVYKVSWIVGTDFVYSCGIDDVIVRDGVPGAMKAMTPLISFRTNKMSVVESTMGIVDDLAINVFKKRSIISKMPPAPNIAINMSALEKVTHLGNMRLMPEDLLDIYTVRGILFVDDTNDYADPFPNQGSTPRPIIELPNTTLDQLRSIQIDLQMSMDALIQITGSNSLTENAGNPTNVLNKVAEGYDQASNRALSWLYTANQSIQTNIYVQLAKRYQVIGSNGPMAIKWLPMGMDTLHIVMLGPEVALSDFMTIVKPGMDAFTKQALIQSVTTYKQNNQISAADEMAVINMITRAQYRKAQFYLATAVEKRRQQDAMMQQANMAAQAQAQGQATVMTEQEKQKSIGASTQAQIALLQEEYRLRNEFEENQVQRDIRRQSTQKATDALVDSAMAQETA